MMTQLDYAQRPAILTRKRTRRIIATVILLALALTAFHQRRNIEFYLRQAKLLYVQRQWLNFSPPPDQVVYDDNSADLATLLAQPHYKEVRLSHGKAVLWDPPAMGDLWRCAVGGGVRGAGLLFMHERFTPDGERFIITCELFTTIDEAGKVRPAIQAFEFRPATWHTNIQMRNGLTTELPLEIERAMRARKRVKLYAGQPDPKDPSHYTIRCDIDGIGYILHGYEGDRIEDAHGIPTPGLRLELRAHP